ncbi:MAG: TIGR01212 family radical SAM protein [Clostridia bacterium]|nr:TIGR01212 family radical SAM protein [Clostridia bacterium]
MIHYYSLNDYCRKTFGHKLYKLSLDGGMTCPNRDGKIGTGGCIFCSEEGSGEFAEKRCGDITFQLENAKRRVEHKNKGGKYIAYFQSFTNTYAPIPYLEKIFTEALNHPDVEVFSVATRPDCLGDDVLRLFEKLNRIKPVWVELGFQTSNEKSALYIGRGYENGVFEKAVKDLNAIGIKTVAHIILGLPDETYDDMENSVKFVCDCGIWGIKLHLLHVLKGTGLAKEYERGAFRCMDENEYLCTVCRLLKIIPRDVVIHRLTGDGDKRRLIAPLWSGNKKEVLNSLAKMLREQNIVQGSECEY